MQARVLEMWEMGKCFHIRTSEEANQNEKTCRVLGNSKKSYRIRRVNFSSHTYIDSLAHGYCFDPNNIATRSSDIPSGNLWLATSDNMHKVNPTSFSQAIFLSWIAMEAQAFLV